MKMNRALIAAVLSAAMIATGIPAIAQATQDNTSGSNAATTQTAPMTRWHRGPRGAHMRQMMIKKLNLSQQQQDQLQPIFQNQRRQAMAIRQDTSLTPDQRQAKMQVLRQDTQSKINGVLTPEQQQQWAQMRSQFSARMHHRMQARMAQKLNLTPQQQDQLQPIMQNQRQQARAIWQDNSLTRQQKREKLQALHQDSMAQMNQILTPEQQQQMQQMRQNSRKRWHGQGPASNAQPAPQR